MKLVFLLAIIPILAFAPFCSAEPLITSSSQNLAHGQTITISGSGFGAKDPAAPAIWNTFETGNVSAEWDRYMPYNANPEYNMQYRTMPYRGVPVPHLSGNNSRCMVGGHDPAGYPQVGGGSNGPNVRVAKAIFGGNLLYITYYNRLDDGWPTGVGTNNNKHGEGPTSGTNFMWATGLVELSSMCAPGNDGWLTRSSVACYDDHAPDYGCSHDETQALRNAHIITWSNLKSWHRLEEFFKGGESGFLQTLIDNVEKFKSTCNPFSYNIAGVEIGEYWRNTIAPDGTNDTGHADAFLYYDDIYVDTTFSRVILANSPNYSLATIVEPQIPSAWSDSSITAKVNLGRLPDTGTAYLFIFDSNNSHNQEGYPIALSGTACLHKSDSDCDSCVSDTELTSFIDRWKVNSQDVTLKEIIEAIGLWKRGCA